MKLTWRGTEVLSAAIIELLLAVIFTDLLLLIISTFLLVLLLGDFYTAYKTLERDRRALENMNSPEPLIKIFKGKVRSVELHLPRPLNSRVTADPEWVKVTSRGDKLLLTITPQTFGRYNIRFNITSQSRLGFWSTSYTSKPLLEVLALPSATPILARALSLIADLTSPGEDEGEEEKRAKRSPGVEYVGLREYEVGDSCRRINWLASLRAQKLIINEYLAGGGSLSLLVNLDSPSSAVLDFTISASLAVALASVQSGVDFTLYVISGGVLESTPSLDPLRGLEVLVRLALEKYGLGFEALEYISPQPSPRLARVAEILKSLNLEKLFKDRTAKARYFTAKMRDTNLIVYCGNLVTNTQLLIDLLTSLKPGTRVVFVVHPKPWIEVKDPQEASIIAKTHERVSSFLRKHYAVYSKPEAAGEEVLLYSLSLSLSRPEKAAP
jgi:uncharacterized protein (DUF58 family)